MKRTNARNILVFSDLHANKRALADIAPVLHMFDLSIFCGDLVGYGKDIDYCLDFVSKNVDLVVQGDHERLAITSGGLGNLLPAVKESTLYNRNKLSVEQKEVLSSLPTEIWHEDLYVTHSINDDYLRTEEDFKRLYSRMRKETKYAFFGHTHEQVMFKNESKTIVNPGSITKGRRGFQRGYAIIHDEKVEFVKLGSII